LPSGLEVALAYGRAVLVDGDAEHRARGVLDMLRAEGGISRPR